MESRNFQLETEWNIIHYPEQPQGFGILIIGDERHFVDEKTSYWMQNEGKDMLLKSLQKAGYTIFYSNLYGRNWGSDKAVKLAKRLYEHMIRSEIMNDKIHIIAEGMGALVGLKLLGQMESSIRSMVLINPILSLRHHLELEKDRKFFYKKLVRELSCSYEQDEKKIIEQLAEVDAPLPLNPTIPLKIIQVLSDSRAYKQSHLLNQLSVKWEDEKASISVRYMVSEKRLQVANQIIRFFKSHEEVL
ncbi:hydrolase [Bacillus sp. V3B]|uniref:alpha/beta hydrolase n=1 Tax=Bacillus sp. V3B TaxID=2804915 RepID=UPI00210A56D6|nr:alpha/beta hydrolase [Bacillus sp. V3B]MCQ6274321.1 hydrolase [Bacillus sp. V3B]